MCEIHILPVPRPQHGAVADAVGSLHLLPSCAHLAARPPIHNSLHMRWAPHCSSNPRVGSGSAIAATSFRIPEAVHSIHYNPCSSGATFHRLRCTRSLLVPGVFGRILDVLAQRCHQRPRGGNTRALRRLLLGCDLRAVWHSSLHSWLRTCKGQGLDGSEKPGARALASQCCASSGDFAQSLSRSSVREGMHRLLLNLSGPVW